MTYSIDYIRSTASQAKKEAEGWQLLVTILDESNLTDEQWYNVNLALRFPVGLEKKQGVKTL